MKHNPLRSPLFAYCTILLAFAVTLFALKENLNMMILAQTVHADSKSLLNGVDVKTYDAQSRLVYQVQSPILQHFTHSGDMEFENIDLLYKSPDGPGIKVKSGEGTLVKSSNNIYLNKDVYLKRLADKDNEVQTLHTQNVIIDLDEKLAHTEQEATLEQGSQRVMGKGMVANLKTSEIKLKSNTRVIYEE